MNIHPDDILFFTEVSRVMRIVAKNYDLPLRNITGLAMPKSGMADRMGECTHTGDIRLVLRCTVDGQWCEEPMSPGEVWNTAAHELAHLRHFNHGTEFWNFVEELLTAVENQQTDHKQKIINKLLKLQKSRQGEAELGNEAAAEAFASAINRMMIEYELNPTDLDYARATDNDPIVQITAQNEFYGIEKSKVRVAWQESLAAGVANAHLCKILISPGSNRIFFLGTKSHATVAEYVYGTMVPFIAKQSKKAEIAYWHETGCGRGANNKALGYRSAWIDAFIKRIWERFREARDLAVAESAAKMGTSSETGLMRLGGALAKVQKYIDDRFKNAAKSSAGALNARSRNHSAGREAGRAAADNVVLGQRGVNAAADRKRIG